MPLQLALRALYERSFGALNRAYGSALGYFLRRRLDLILALVAVFAVTQQAARDRLDMVPMSESFLLPLSILVTIPLANLGVTWIHLLTGRDMDFLGLVGLIILIGVVVNNGIVLLDYANRLRARGLERREALLLACERRYRPIMMTALTTICGMVSLTFGQASRLGISYKSFGLPP